MDIEKIFSFLHADQLKKNNFLSKYVDEWAKTASGSFLDFYLSQFTTDVKKDLYNSILANCMANGALSKKMIVGYLAKYLQAEQEKERTLFINMENKFIDTDEALYEKYKLNAIESIETDVTSLIKSELTQHDEQVSIVKSANASMSNITADNFDNSDSSRSNPVLQEGSASASDSTAETKHERDPQTLKIRRNHYSIDYAGVAQRERMNQIRNIAHDTKVRCLELVKEEHNKAALTRYVIFDPNGEITQQCPKDIIPIEKTNPELSQLQQQHIKNLTFSHTAIKIEYGNPLDACVDNGKKEKTIYCCAASQMGSNADQGYETIETPLYLCSTYSAVIESLVDEFPIDGLKLVYIPCVVVFKDYNKHDYPFVSVLKMFRTSVMCIPCKNRPCTSLYPSTKQVDQSPEFNKRLLDPDVKLTQAEFDIHYAQLQNGMRYCSMIGTEHVVLDDRGVEDYWVPLYSVIQLYKKLFVEFNGKFKSINIYSSKRHIYEVLRRELSKK